MSDTTLPDRELQIGLTSGMLDTAAISVSEGRGGEGFHAHALSPTLPLT